MFYPSNIKQLPVSRFIVSDRSMEPVFYDGDHVLTFNWIRPRRGDVIVFRSNGKNLIKRVEKINDGEIFVKGDNRKISSKIGPVKSDQIVGKVILKY